MGIKIHGLQLGKFPVPMDMLFDPSAGRTPQRNDGDIIDGVYHVRRCRT